MKFTKRPDLDLFESTLSEKSILKKFQIFGAHEDLCDRLKKTLYYGCLPKSPHSSLPLTEAAVELFSRTVPKGKLGIIDSDFASSVSRKASISPCSLMIALVYLERLRHKNPEYLQTVSSCDLFLVSMMVASKYLFDDGDEEEIFNDEWACLANMDAKDINSLERDFLAAIDWELYVKPETFFEMLHGIESKIAQQEASKRGWHTYTDIHMLSGKVLLQHCWNLLYEDVMKVVVVSTIAYVSAIATLATALTLSHHCSVLMKEHSAALTNPSQTINHSDSALGSLLPALLVRNHLFLHTTQTNPELENCVLNEECGQPFNDSYFQQPKHFEHSLFGNRYDLSDFNPFTSVKNGLAHLLSVARTIVEGITVTRGQKEEFLESFQYAPTCCGGVNSYFL